MDPREPTSGAGLRAFGQSLVALATRWRSDRSIFAEAAFLGTAVAILLTVGDQVGQKLGAAPQSLLERAHVRLLGSWIDLVALAIQAVSAPWHLLPLAVPLTLAVPRATRPVGVALLAVAAELAATLLCTIPFGACAVMNPGLGVLAVVLAVPVALLLARIPRWPLSAMVVVAGGVTFGAAIGVLFNDDTFAAWGVENRFLASTSLSLMIALTIAAFDRTRAPMTAWRVAGMWGLSAVTLSSVAMVTLVGVQLHRASADSSARFVDDWAYDLVLTGDPPQLVWADKNRVHALTDPYGASHDHYLLSESATFPQRIWPSATDGFYVQTLHGVDWWPAPRGDQRIPPEPAVRYPKPAEIRDGPPWGFAEDTARNRVFLASEWQSYFAVMDHDTAAVTARGRIGTAFWPAFHATPDPAARALYLSSCMEEGTLYKVDLDTLQVTASAPSLFLYETVLDATRHLLWGSRPITGELLGIDTETLEVRRRIPLTFGNRDLTRDPVTGDLYTCAFLSGEVFRVDVSTGAVSQLGLCGRLCRNLVVDPARQSVWVATRDRICRLPMAGTVP